MMVIDVWKNPFLLRQKFTTSPCPPGYVASYMLVTMGCWDQGVGGQGSAFLEQVGWIPFNKDISRDWNYQ